MTAKELIDWEAYAELEPFDEMRDDYRFAHVVQMIYNMAVDPKHRKELDHFLLDFGGEKKKRKQTVEEQENIIKIFVNSMAGIKG